MNNTIKKIIKYLAVFAVIGAVIFLAIKLLFPQPSNLQAYNNNLELTRIETYDDLLEQTNQLLSRSAPHLEDATLNSQNLSKLIISKQVIMSLDAANELIIDDLAFAKNTTTYNRVVKDATKALGEIKKSYAEVNTYLTNTLKPFLNQNPSTTAGQLNIYIDAILTFYSDLCEQYQTYTIANVQIFNQLNLTLRNNAWSQTVLNIVDKWTGNLVAKLGNAETNFASQVDNATHCLEFVLNNINEEGFVSYYTENNNLNEKIEEIGKTNIAQLVNVVLTQGEQPYVDAIENAETKTASINVLSFLKGAN